MTPRWIHGFAVLAMLLAAPVAARAQVDAPTPVSRKLPPGLTFSVAAGPVSGGQRFGGTFERTRSPVVSASVEVAMNRFMLAQGEVFTWREKSSGRVKGRSVTGSLGTGYTGDFIFDDSDRNTLIAGNFIGRFGAGRFYGNAGVGFGFGWQRRVHSEQRLGCVPEFLGACDVLPFSFDGTSRTFMMQFLAGVDVVLSPRLTAFASIRTVAFDSGLTPVTGGVRWTARRTPVSPGWRMAANPVKAADAIGTSVHVEAFDHSRQNGTLVSLTSTHVTIRRRAGAITLPLTEVRGIRRQSHAILKGTLIGMAAGAGAAVVMCASQGGCGEGTGWLMVMTAGIGAGAGGGIGAMVNLQTAEVRTLYVNPRQSAFAITPILGKQRAGVGARVAW